MSAPIKPTPKSVQAWCRAFLVADGLNDKLRPQRPPNATETTAWEPDAPAERWAKPSRPQELTVVERSQKTPGRGAMQHTNRRAELLHTLAHHELQAAELFAWAILAFPETPIEFRAGLLRLAQEELGHLALYIGHLEKLGHQFGEWPVRDWFWTRMHRCDTPLQFVAFVGLGLEGANLEHTARFADWFREAGDLAGAAILDRVEQDEVGHVSFARRWFETFQGGPLRFSDWSAQLPSPLTPAVFRGTPLNQSARLRAGLSPDFLTELVNSREAHRGPQAAPGASKK